MNAARKLDAPIPFRLGPVALDAPRASRTLGLVASKKRGRQRDGRALVADMVNAGQLALAKGMIDAVLPAVESTYGIWIRLRDEARLHPADLSLNLAARVAHGLHVALRSPGATAEQALKGAVNALKDISAAYEVSPGVDVIPHADGPKRALALIAANADALRAANAKRYKLAALIAYQSVQRHVLPSRQPPARSNVSETKTGLQLTKVVLTDDERNLAAQIKTEVDRGKADAEKISEWALRAHGWTYQAARDYVRKAPGAKKVKDPGKKT